MPGDLEPGFAGALRPHRPLKGLAVYITVNVRQNLHRFPTESSLATAVLYSSGFMQQIA